MLNRNKRSLFGSIVTILWILLCLFIVRSKWGEAHTLKLNEWGDVFAGFVAPLAFFWFVLSFLQQSEELKQNTKALELQSEELRSSVEHQRAMVEVTRLQVENELEASRQEKARVRHAAQPKFVFLGSGGMHTQGNHQYSLRYQNVGNTASEITILNEPVPPRHSSFRIPSVLRGGILELTLSYNDPKDNVSKLSLYFTDAMGNPGEVHFMLNTDRAGSLDSVPWAEPTNA